MHHFTYNGTINTKSLYQGDVISVTEIIKEVLQKYHPYYNDIKNKYFIILTQSCDLAPRENNKCKAPYIILSPVRRIEYILQKERFKFVFDDFDRENKLLAEKNLDKYKQFIEKLLNNNNDRYFYLHKDESQNFYDSYCAVLRLSIPLKSEHYNKLLEGKILQLNESFQHKLGYLVGNTYNRVGTKDWETNADYNDVLSKYISEIKNELLILPDEKYKRLCKRRKKMNLETEDLNIDKLLTAIEEEIKEMKSEKESHFYDILIKIGLEEITIKKIYNNLRNSPVFKSIFS